MTWLDDVRRRVPVPPPLEIPERYGTESLAAIPNADIRQVIADYLLAFWTAAPAGKGPLLLGRTGTWKTTALALLARTVHRQVGIEVAWVSVPRYVLRLDLDRFDADLHRTIQHWGTVPFLVMDDWTEIQPNSQAHRVLVATMTARYDARLPTAWSGNLILTPGRETQELGDRYGHLFARRLVETSEGFRMMLA